ncbi:golgin subfamily A member 2 isoform X2 [Apis cerana]|uniref:golgin subfamily A member 2 isoform X2 n=1 Tax=Apis cerana TaxID=7461 RepID=UPI0007E2C8A2|nr:golgin subfamily A member 2 isoform X2 [Apis cerana]
MNLSKSEKLLAAKRKLREFQLSKMQNNQDGSIKQKYTLDLLSSQCQNAETNKLNLEVISNVLTMETSKDNSQEFQKNDVVMNSMVTSENIINYNELNCSMENTNSMKDTQENNVISKLEEKLNLNEFPKIQKEHLLEMASAVENVLTNEFEHIETSLDFDLMNHNQFLNSYLEEQKKIVNELHIKLNNAHSRISELETKLKEKEIEFQIQLEQEINPLKDQVQIHTQTTGILIAEKTELTSALCQAQQNEAEEISKKLKNSQIRILELEKEILFIKNNNEELNKNFHQLQNKYDSLNEQFFQLKKEKEDLDLEGSELKQKLNLKKTELIAIQQELQEKTALLSLSELRIQQMKGMSITEEEKHTAILLEQELVQTKESLKIVNNEKDEINKQYQNYVKQLDTQQTKLLEKIKIQKKIIEDLQYKEQNRVEKISELEQQLQQEIEKVENLLPLQDCKNQIDNLLKNIDELTLEQERFHIILSEKDSQIEILTKNLNDLQETNNQETEITKLVSALESEQLGASRAIQQNHQLKEQLTDMENAFVSLSNAKLDLTEQLQAERSIGRKLNIQLNNIENELEQLKAKLKEKEAILQEFEKERLQSAQIADQIQHYQAQSHHVNTFQQELQHAIITIERLEKEKQALTQKLKENNSENFVSEDNLYSIITNNNISSLEENTHVESLNKNSVIVPEPIKQLEQRFKETMEQVAELTEEKQKLEHVVLQLQSETETIGEYITLYQKQRAVLQNRAIEREKIFRQLLEQRNQQQEQLHKLKVLVSDFLRKEYIHSNETNRLIETEMNSNDSLILETRREIIDSQIENKNVSELLDVLTEIKDCKDSCIFESNFHLCPWCSGKLLTV